MNEIITNEIRYRTTEERIKAFSESCKDKGGISEDGRSFLSDFLSWLNLPDVEETKERTNEELAAELLETVGLDSPFCTCDRCKIVREAAARLRDVTVRSDNSAVIAELAKCWQPKAEN